LLRSRDSIAGRVIVGDSLSIVMPVFNEEAHLAATVDALAVALDGSGFTAELVLVDDGSSDDSVAVARTEADGRLDLRVVRQPNRGRFEARRAGLEAAEGDYVLFLDARVRLVPGALRFVQPRLAREPVWNGHVHVEAENAFGEFWRLLAELAWRDYFDDPRTTSYGLEDFDRYPKGTTCFLAPRALLAEAFAQFRSHYADVRLANDDTPVLRAIAAAQRIHLSPEFGCVYSPRTNAGSFFRHAVHRGIVFVDGHGTPESRFFPAVAAFFPLSAALVLRPRLLPAALAACGAAAAAYGLRARRPPHDVAVLAAVTPLYALAHGLGMWRGAFELVRGAARQ
jgi:glycosyltransferase involved in cell wall biosynthesis